MKKLATIIGGLICLRVMSKPKTPEIPKVINNYFITKTGCSGGCSCGKHR